MDAVLDVGAGNEVFFCEGGEAAVGVAGVLGEGFDDGFVGGGAVLEEEGEDFGMAGGEKDILEADVLVEDGELEFFELGGGEGFDDGGEAGCWVLSEGLDEALPDGV